MKRYSQLNIIRDRRQLHYLVELGSVVGVSYGEYSYTTQNPGVIQFIHNGFYMNTIYERTIHNVLNDNNLWYIDDGVYINNYIPTTMTQREVLLYIPRYSIESFFDKEFGQDNEMSLSGIKYVLSAYTFIGEKKVVLGSYLFDLGASLATPDKLHYKMDDYYLYIKFHMADPESMVYNDEWAQFRQVICGEPANINNTGAVLHLSLEPVILGEDKTYYMISSEFQGANTSIPFETKMTDYLHAILNFNGDATLGLSFNEVYEGDLPLYLGETYNMWLRDDDGEIIRDTNGNPIPQDYLMIYELVIKDEDNIYYYNCQLIGSPYPPEFDSTTLTYTFSRSLMEHDWSWFNEGMWLQGGVSIYITPNDLDPTMDDEQIIEYLRTTQVPTAELVSNEIALDKENYRFLTPQVLLPNGKIDFNLVNMNDYNISTVNKVIKNVVTVNRPDEYKSNIIKPVFIRTEPLNNTTIHPAVTENISLNLDRYKSSVDIFYIRIEGVDFIEIGRTKQAVVFTVDGHLLPNEVTEGIYYLLDQDHNLVTTGNYKYEQ